MVALFRQVCTLGKYVMRYLLGIFICLDQLVNFMLLGYEDETYSSRCHRWHRDGVRLWPKRIVNALFFWQKDHCKQSYDSERDGRHHPPELR